MRIQSPIIPAEKELLPSVYEKTKRNQIPLKNPLIVVYNWLNAMNSIPNDFDSLLKNDLEVIAKRITHFYIVDNKYLFEMFY